MYTLIAQNLRIPGVSGYISGPTGFLLGDSSLAGIVSSSLSIVFPVAGLALLAFLIWGGFDYMTSLGDPKKAAAARLKMTSAVIGFIIMVAAFFIVQITDYVFKLGVYSGSTPVQVYLKPAKTSFTKDEQISVEIRMKNNGAEKKVTSAGIKIRFDTPYASAGIPSCAGGILPNDRITTAGPSELELSCSVDLGQQSITVPSNSDVLLGAFTLTGSAAGPFNITFAKTQVIQMPSNTNLTGPGQGVGLTIVP